MAESVPITSSSSEMDNFESEDDQLRAAIAASLEDNGATSSFVNTEPEQRVKPPLKISEDEELARAIAASLEPLNAKQQQEQQQQQLQQGQLPPPTKTSVQIQEKNQSVINNNDSFGTSSETSAVEETQQQTLQQQKAKSVHPPIDTSKFVIAEPGNPPETTRMQLKFADGKREVVRLKLETPLAALYELFREKIGEEARSKDFVLLFLEKSLTLEDTMDSTLRDSGIANASIQFKWA